MLFDSQAGLTVFVLLAVVISGVAYIIRVCTRYVQESDAAMAKSALSSESTLSCTCENETVVPARSRGAMTREDTVLCPHCNKIINAASSERGDCDRQLRKHANAEL